MLYIIHRFPESFVRDPFVTKRCSIKLKDEEAEIKLTGSVLEEEANMAEIEEDKGDARIWPPNIDVLRFQKNTTQKNRYEE